MRAPSTSGYSLRVVSCINLVASLNHWDTLTVTGSGGFMSDLTFNGGATGASMGNQQYTMRNLVFNNCQTGKSFFF